MYKIHLIKQWEFQMKKLASITLLSILSLSFTACSSNSSTPQANDSATETVTEAAAETTIIQTEAVTEPLPVNTESSAATTGQKNALKKAQTYLSFSAFSQSGLINQLKFEGFSDNEAAYGANNCGADWNEQAVKKAKNYLSYSAFSYDGLIQQLEFEGFSSEQAENGANNCGADWNEQELKKPKAI